MDNDFKFKYIKDGNILYNEDGLEAKVEKEAEKLLAEIKETDRGKEEISDLLEKVVGAFKNGPLLSTNNGKYDQQKSLKPELCEEKSTMSSSTLERTSLEEEANSRASSRLTHRAKNPGKTKEDPHDSNQRERKEIAEPEKNFNFQRTRTESGKGVSFETEKKMTVNEKISVKGKLKGKANYKMIDGKLCLAAKRDKYGNIYIPGGEMTVGKAGIGGKAALEMSLGKRDVEIDVSAKANATGVKAKALNTNIKTGSATSDTSGPVKVKASMEAKATGVNLRALNTNIEKEKEEGPFRVKAEADVKGVDVNVANADVVGRRSGTIVEASAKVYGAQFNAGNVSVTGVDNRTKVGASLKAGVRADFGNIQVSGFGQKETVAEADVTAGISAGNIAVGFSRTTGAKATTQFSIGNVNLTIGPPSLSFSPGFDIGIPFLSGGGVGTSGGGGGGGGSGGGDDGGGGTKNGTSGGSGGAAGGKDHSGSGSSSTSNNFVGNGVYHSFESKGLEHGTNDANSRLAGFDLEEKSRKRSRTYNTGLKNGVYNNTHNAGDCNHFDQLSSHRSRNRNTDMFEHNNQVHQKNTVGSGENTTRNVKGYVLENRSLDNGESSESDDVVIVIEDAHSNDIVEITKTLSTGNFQGNYDEGAASNRNLSGRVGRTTLTGDRRDSMGSSWPDTAYNSSHTDEYGFDSQGIGGISSKHPRRDREVNSSRCKNYTDKDGSGNDTEVTGDSFSRRGRCTPRLQNRHDDLSHHSIIGRNSTRFSDQNSNGISDDQSNVSKLESEKRTDRKKKGKVTSRFEFDSDLSGQIDIPLERDKKIIGKDVDPKGKPHVGKSDNNGDSKSPPTNVRTKSGYNRRLRALVDQEMGSKKREVAKPTGGKSTTKQDGFTESAYWKDTDRVKGDILHEYKGYDPSLHAGNPTRRAKGDPNVAAGTGNIGYGEGETEVRKPRKKEPKKKPFGEKKNIHTIFTLDDSDGKQIKYLKNNVACFEED